MDNQLDLHPLLKRQINRSIPKYLLAEDLLAFIRLVNDTYVSDDQDRKLLERSLEISSDELIGKNSQIQAIFQAFPDTFLRVDFDGKILDYKNTHINFSKMFPSLAVGSFIQKVSEFNFNAVFEAPLKWIRETDQLITFEHSFEYECKPFYFEGRMKTLLKNDVLIIIRDITERKKTEEERFLKQQFLEQQTKELESYQRATLNILEDIKEARNMLEISSKELFRSNKELEQFAYVASHDLQEPIRKIVGFIQLFAKKFEGRMDKDAQEDMNFIVDGAKRMQTLIQDLLQFSRVGRTELILESVNFNDILKEAVDNLEISIKENQAKIHYNGLPTLPVHKSQIIQLFQNLIGNAIKYRGDTPPEIFITAQMKNSEWEFSVQDNGIGIDPEFFGRLFIIFQRLHAKDKYPGTGIGLALCKKIVERHRGKIWVESQAGKGSIFKFTLPVSQK